MTQITLKGLAHSYLPNPEHESDYALREMDHVWEQGGAYALLGPSGCGKSTLLNIISGLLNPSQGKVMFDGKEVNHLPPEQRNIAQVFQFPVVYDSMTVRDNLAFPLRNLKLDKVRIDQKVAEVADVLELEEVLHARANNLSADLKQKISMGRGLVRDDVSAILFDEPLTVIDPHLKWKLRRKLKQIHERFNITMVYVTHDQLEAATFADKIAVMYEGQIVQFGTPQELFENPRHTFVGYFIGSPGMNFIDVTPGDGGLSFDEFTVPVTNSLQQQLSTLGSSNIKIGIRPEYVALTDQHDPAALRAEVLDIEDLGSYKILELKLGHHTLRARISEQQTVPAEHAWIRFPPGQVKIYVDELLIGEASG